MDRETRNIYRFFLHKVELLTTFCNNFRNLQQPNLFKAGFNVGGNVTSLSNSFGSNVGKKLHVLVAPFTVIRQARKSSCVELSEILLPRLNP